MLEGSGATPGRDGAVKRPRLPAEKTQAAVEILLAHQPVAVYAFGSQVAGTARADSDLDLAVLLHPGRRLSVEQKMDLTERLGAAVGRDVDLIILNEARLPLQFEIIRSGHVLFESSFEDRVSAEETIVRDYLDFEPFLRQSAREILEAAQERGSRPAPSGSSGGKT
jgi:predicted nucleotidyltransferase